MQSLSRGKNLKKVEIISSDVLENQEKAPPFLRGVGKVTPFLLLE